MELRYDIIVFIKYFTKRTIMKKLIWNRILSIALVLIIVIGLSPVITMPAVAEAESPSNEVYLIQYAQRLYDEIMADYSVTGIDGYCDLRLFSLESRYEGLQNMQSTQNWIEGLLDFSSAMPAMTIGVLTGNGSYIANFGKEAAIATIGYALDQTIFNPDNYETTERELIDSTAINGYKKGKEYLEDVRTSGNDIAAHGGVVMDGSDAYTFINSYYKHKMNHDALMMGVNYYLEESHTSEAENLGRVIHDAAFDVAAGFASNALPVDIKSADFIKEIGVNGLFSVYNTVQETLVEEIDSVAYSNYVATTAGYQTELNNALNSSKQVVELNVPFSGDVITSQNVQDALSARGWNRAFNDTFYYVTLDSRITRIEQGAFYSCQGLTAVNLTNVSVIEDLAFAGCPYLFPSIVIPETLTHLGSNVFKDCTRLFSVEFKGEAPTSYGANAFGGNLSNFVAPARYSNVWLDLKESLSGLINNIRWRLDNGHMSHMPGEPSDGTYSDLRFRIEKGVAFVTSCSSNAANITIPDRFLGFRVFGIDEQAFYGLTSLSQVTFGANIVEVGNHTFVYCHNLAKVTLNNKLQKIGNGAFDGTSLTSLTLPNSVKSIGDYAFAGTKLTALTIPNSVTDLGYNVVSGCSELETFVIGNGVTREIYDREYYYSSLPKLKTLVLGDGITSIGVDAFRDHTLLSQVTFGANIVEIGNYAFSSCNNLDDVTLNSKLQKIGDMAFYGTGLTSLTLPNSVKSIGDSAFGNCNALTIYVSDQKMKNLVSGKGVPDERIIISGESDPSTTYAGDASGDGNVTAADALIVLKYALSPSSLTPEQFAVYDINQDSLITIEDVLVILQTAAGDVPLCPIAAMSK